jgi:hypothetical protein
MQVARTRQSLFLLDSNGRFRDRIRRMMPLGKSGPFVHPRSTGEKVYGSRRDAER